MSAPVFTAGMPVLSLLLLVPLTGGVLAMLLPPRWAKHTAALFSLLTLLLASGAYYDYNPYTPGYAMEEHYPWIPPVGAAYHLGVDGLSMPLVLLTALLTFLAVVFSWDTDYRPREFFSMLLLMDVGVMGVFVSLDLLLFFLFWEAQLVPMYFLIALWGGPRKRYAALKFFLYTQAGSLLILLGIAAMYLQATNPALPGALPQPTFDMPALAQAL
ncbi:MAG: hypothetical protein HY558_00110, partial [Euryarchaeota archaeon]|nr:hypothetical protein [Euryarchaeota archaeon]